MGNKTFIDNGLKKELVQDMEKKTKLEDKIEKHIEKALNAVSKATLYSIMNLVIETGHPQQSRHMEQVKKI